MAVDGGDMAELGQRETGLARVETQQLSPARRRPTSRRARVVGSLLLVGVLGWMAVYAAWAVGGFASIAIRPGAHLPGALAGVLPAAPTMTPPASASPGATPSAQAPSRPRVTGPGGFPPATPSPTAVPVDFGMSGHLMWHPLPTAIHELDMLKADGLDVVRFDVSWRSVEPQPGHYAGLSKLDAIVDAALVRHIRPIVTIIETPGWANSGQDAWVPPSDPADYAAFAGMLAARYAGRVDAWEVWNEPDIPLFWRPTPDPAAYARLLRAASEAIWAANPKATVVGGSVTFGNVNYLKALYADGAKGTFNVLAVHPYTLTRAPDDQRDRYHSLTAILDDMRGVMVANGDAAIPIWVTELGWAVIGLNSVSPMQRIAYLAESVALIEARPFVQVVTVYTIDTADSARFGLSTNGQRSAAWLAYVAAVRAARQHAAPSPTSAPSLAAPARGLSRPT